MIGTLNVIRHGVRLMIDNPKNSTGQRGSIINVSSIAAYEGRSGTSAYSASKGAIAAMTLPLARELAEYGIRVNAVAPGIFDTPMVRAGLDEASLKELCSKIPNPSRMGDPKEFAKLVKQLIKNPYINGEVIRLDGAFRVPL